MTAARETDRTLVLFPVERRPLFFREQSSGGSVGKTGERYHEVPRFEAVVDAERNHTFAVVSERYRLVENREALNLGEHCFRQVFSAATADGMEVFNIILPATRSFCHVDFIHKDHSFEPWGGDRWWPYLRVTNSYNRTKPLRFDLGFCRAICTNGVIFGREHIVFRYYHTHEQIAVEGKFRVDATRLKDLEVRFIEQVHNLKRYYVPPEHMLALACKVLQVEIKPADLRDPRKRKRLVEFRDDVERLTNKYFTELGPNGYAAFNVMTDFASRPMLYISQEAMIDPLQKRCGDWASNFIAAIQDPSFDFNKYLGDFARGAEALSA
jgi:hypothetical protein